MLVKKNDVSSYELGIGGVKITKQSRKRTGTVKDFFQVLNKVSRDSNISLYTNTKWLMNYSIFFILPIWQWMSDDFFTDEEGLEI